MQEATKAQMNKMTNNLVSSASEMNSIIHDAVCATLQSASVWVNGCSDLCDTMSGLMQRTIEQSSSVTQTMFECTSVNDIMNKQSDMMKSNFDTIMSDMSNISQLSTRIAQEAAEPVTNHVNQTITKISKSTMTNCCSMKAA